MDDDRLKQGEALFGKDYFRELLERVRSIRASKRRIYQQITDIFAECSIDYDPKSEITRKFYAMVQNRFHFAIMGENRCWNHLSSSRFFKKEYGLNHLEIHPWWKDFEIRYCRSQKLFAGKRNQAIGENDIRIFWLHRKSNWTSKYVHNEPIGR